VLHGNGSGREQRRRGGGNGSGQEEGVIMEVKKKLMQEKDVHPNHPSIDIKAYSKWDL
jgi:hypothetical protein